MLEVELKLDVSPDAAAVIAASDLFDGDPQRRQLDATYFDTPGQALRGAGFSLRIRSSDGHRIQTVKADGAATAGLFVRSEWEMDVDGDAPVLDHTTPIRATLGARCEDIEALFNVAVERRIWNVDEDGAQIEVVLDQGRIRSAGREEEVCEIELELKSGDPAALFSFARKLDAMAPVHIGVLSKAARGYRLIQKPRAAFKAAPVTLKPEMGAAVAFQHIAQACLRQFRLNEAAVLVHRAPEALHQARVALRRLRSAFSVFAPLFEEDEQAALLRLELRALAAILGEARNLDVLIARAQGGALQDRLQSARDSAYADVEAALGSPKARAMMLDLMEWLATGPWLSEAQPQGGEPARSFAQAALDRYRRKVKKGGRRLAKADDEARHELRKDAKKLRYAAEFFSSLFDDKKSRRRYKRFIAALEDMQDHLGVLNDLATAPAEMAKLGLQDDPQAQVLLGTEAKAPLIAAAAEAHEALIDTKRFWR